MQKLSRTKIELSLTCPRCFWLDVVKGVKRPPPAPYTINSAIDYLLKQEFDVYREKGEPHPIMTRNNIGAIPFAHPKLDTWRHNFTGVSYHYEPTDMHIFGAVDDIWVNPKGEVMVVDYKATGANQHNIYDSYQRQMEVYQWLLRKNDLKVLPTGYFVFARVDKGGGFSETGEGIKGSLPFNIFVESYEGDDAWVEEAIHGARRVLDLSTAPAADKECEYCMYRESAQLSVAVEKAEKKSVKGNGKGGALL
ncbi:MAG: PD-(D/E)XK nuclease family protein [Candidatus Liptonbacteria bacterium]|nr:PD-(D/E)XK nuclease family protein [Candidatus Liptonbacteria bacterium]